MKFTSSLLLFSLLFAGCDLRERERAIEQKAARLIEKEQELLLKEKALRITEDELTHKKKFLDSSSASLPDSTAQLFPQLPGKWDVTMRCTETTCTGSAVGDIKNEQWEMTNQHGKIIAQAFSGNKLVRVYSGTLHGNTIELLTTTDTLEPAPVAKITVRIKEAKANEMTGERNIVRPDNCQIMYSLDFRKL